jgi:hypothetical protein
MADDIPVTRLDDIPVTRLDYIPIRILDDEQSLMSPNAPVNKIFILDKDRRNIA